MGHAPVPKSEEAKAQITGLPSTEPGGGTEAGTGADVGRLEIQLLNCQTLSRVQKHQRTHSKQGCL